MDLQSGHCPFIQNRSSVGSGRALLWIFKHLTRMAFLVKRNTSTEEFCMNIAGGSEVWAQSWAHGEGRKRAASTTDSGQVRPCWQGTRGVSGGDWARLALPRGCYGSHHSSSPSSTGYFLGASKAVCKVQKKPLSASSWCHWRQNNTPPLTSCSASDPSAHSCLCFSASVKGIANSAHTHFRSFPVSNALSTFFFFNIL